MRLGLGVRVAVRVRVRAKVRVSAATRLGVWTRPPALYSPPWREPGVVCGSDEFITETRHSPNEPHASPPGGFPSAFNRRSPIEPLLH